MAHAARNEFDHRGQRFGNLRQDGRELARPGRVGGEIDFGAHAAHGVVDIFQQRRDCDTTAAFEIGGELSDHALNFSEHDGHAQSVGGLRDARGGIASGGVCRKPDQLPGCGELVHHQDQCIGEDFRAATERGIKQRLDAFQRRAREGLDVLRHLPAKRCEAVANREPAGDDSHIFERVRRADLKGKPPPGFIVVLDRLQHLTHARHCAILEFVGDLRRSGGIVGDECVFNQVGIRFRFRLHDEITNPLPNRIEGSARDAAVVLMLGRVVDQKRFERLEEQAGRIADACNAPAGFAQTAAQFIEHQLGACGIVTAQQAALKLGDQQSARLRLEFNQVLPQPFDGQTLAQHPPHRALISDTF
jgi:hypothetical protein